MLRYFQTIQATKLYWVYFDGSCQLSLWFLTYMQSLLVQSQEWKTNGFSSQKKTHATLNTCQCDVTMACQTAYFYIGCCSTIQFLGLSLYLWPSWLRIIDCCIIDAEVIVLLAIVGTDGEVRAHYCDVFCLVYVCLCVAYIMPVLQLHCKTTHCFAIVRLCFWHEALTCGIMR